MTVNEKELMQRLEKINVALQKEQIEIGRRPWEAMRRYSMEYKTKFLLDSDIARFIFEWFKKRYGDREQHTRALYESVYFFDATFWLVEIPLGYGQFRLDPRDSLRTIPNPVKDTLFTNPRTAWDYALWWADCVDYGFGIREVVQDSSLNPFGLRLLDAGDQELRATVSLLKEICPHSRAILTARNAVELFFKAMLALKNCLRESEAKKLGHDLTKIYELFIKITRFNHWKAVENILNVFPSMEGRYSRQTIDRKALWDAFAFAQSNGVLIVRQFTARNTISQVLEQMNKRNTEITKL